MKAIVCDGYGLADVLKVGTRPLPVLSQEEILIKVHYSALNRADIM
jgi:NADPH:quinone reductase-like Zn-dependent oxidoreductase